MHANRTRNARSTRHAERPRPHPTPSARWTAAVPLSLPRLAWRRIERTQSRSSAQSKRPATQPPTHGVTIRRQAAREESAAGERSEGARTPRLSRLLPRRSGEKRMMLASRNEHPHRHLGAVRCATATGSAKAPLEPASPSYGTAGSTSPPGSMLSWSADRPAAPRTPQRSHKREARPWHLGPIFIFLTLLTKPRLRQETTPYHHDTTRPRREARGP